MSIPAILRIINFPYEGTANSYSVRSGDQTSERTAWVSDILCRKITVYYDDGLPKNDGKPLLNIHIENTRPGAEYENILRTRKITDDYATRQTSNPMTTGHWRVDAPCPLQNKNPPLTRWGSGFLGTKVASNFSNAIAFAGENN